MRTEFGMDEIYPILAEVLGSGGEFRLYPQGISMRPLICAGRDSVILIKPQVLQKNGMYLYRRKNGQFVLHRLVKFDQAGAPVFRGDNQTWLEHGIEPSDIIAEVRAIFHRDRHYSLSSVRYRLYLAKLSFPLYRFFRFLPRRIKNAFSRRNSCGKK